MSKKPSGYYCLLFLAGAALVFLTSFSGQESETSNLDKTIKTQYKEEADPGFPDGKVFSFGVQGDSHPERAGKMFNPDLYSVNVGNVKGADPDFYFLMGDDFNIEKLMEKGAVTQESVNSVYALQKSYLEKLEMPIYLVNGNHEQLAKYLLNGSDNNPAMVARNAREKYFDSPGAETGYYSFSRGNSLFVVIDFYWHSDIAVDSTTGSWEKAAKGKRDLWRITLGDEQYRWLKTTLENSQAKYKFVFSHHVMGTGRGGVEGAKYYEWGGYDHNGEWLFDQKRPNWESPIHQLMAKNGVTIFFQGHDHLFARQELDGVIYQTVPNPADDTYTAFNSQAYKIGTLYPNSGFLEVTVFDDHVRVEYIRSFLSQDETDSSKNGDVAYSYILE